MQKTNNEDIPNTKYELPREKIVRTSKIILLNISGGQHDSDIVEEIKKRANKKYGSSSNEYFLIIAAVGNEGIELKEKNMSWWSYSR